MLKYKIRLWVGSGIFAFGVFWWTWFLRNAFRRRMDKAMLYTKYHPVIQIIINSVWVAIGLWVYPIEKTLPIIPLIAGIALGLYVSRRGNYFFNNA